MIAARSTTTGEVRVVEVILGVAIVLVLGAAHAVGGLLLAVPVMVAVSYLLHRATGRS